MQCFPTYDRHDFISCANKRRSGRTMASKYRSATLQSRHELRSRFTDATVSHCQGLIGVVFSVNSTNWQFFKPLNFSGIDIEINDNSEKRNEILHW